MAVLGLFIRLASLHFCYERFVAMGFSDSIVHDCVNTVHKRIVVAT